MAVMNIEFEPGFLVITEDFGKKTRYPVSSILRAMDIPVLSVDKIVAITTLANLVVVLVKTLIERDILDESFADGYDLQYIVDTLETDLLAEW